ncbi:Linear gramicidin dehydrogenase LgrE [Legionella quinlivanii]|uniref:Linear gramicidin dehydrogenase LgrE n=1 Tax=Legionella quinlivanii TaxID=45073 RepID=A0A0W0XNB7_9GAMM|nr:thioesterase domain-containing protein [Legionella quinlivanii]KTD46056.1 Linear gramicidin dehydrogenase LgrE [Legionella quinlivanii]SEG46920.1 Surfactin synthase thioesterase subunit [Legionella quinlivanii DSM 21216]STY10007.1 Linear gramicidin dehydrogenase LgrE [Legionella quinlivanii]
MTRSDWLFIPKPLAFPRLRLICFPYAGGNASIYKSWGELLPNNVELIAIQPPGRSNRVSEHAFSDMNELMKDLLPSIKNAIDIPYILFGHSLGSRISFELMCQLNKIGAPLPIHFIASGSRGPYIPCTKKAIYNLPENEFIKELIKLNGTPKELLENKELMALLLPTLRADFELSHKYYPSSENTFNCPLSVLGGTEDTEVTPSDLQSWEASFASSATIHMIPGDHFFIESNRHLVLRKINLIIKECLLELASSDSRQSELTY